MGEDDDIDRSVAMHGWHAIAVDDHEPPLLYTCGLVTRWRQPELVVLGLDRRTAYAIASALVGTIRGGGELAANSRLEILDGLVVALQPVHPSRHELYLGYAMAHARRHAVALRALQVLWPDEHGRFPFELACDAEVRAQQPRLELAATPAELRAFRRELGDD